jgi:Arc/MetJ-type ribon-helix-helix transcriptional regulator
MDEQAHRILETRYPMAHAINLPRHIQEYIDRQIAEGRYDSEESVIVEVFEHVIGEEREEYDPELAASIAEADRGEVFELTPELKADIRRQSDENLRRGHKVRDDISF